MKSYTKSTDSKAVVLARIREAQKWARLPDSKYDKELRLESGPHSVDDCLARLREELDLLGVTCFVETSQGGVHERIEAIIEDKSILSWDTQELPYGIGTLLTGKEVYFGHDDAKTQAEADIGLTGCDAAIAETGSLILCSSASKPRTASLLPFEHVALVQRERLFLTMGEFLEQNESKIRGTSGLNIITGPSRTADIELSLTLGVHGPGKVFVVVGP